MPRRSAFEPKRTLTSSTKRQLSPILWPSGYDMLKSRFGHRNKLLTIDVLVTFKMESAEKEIVRDIHFLAFGDEEGEETAELAVAFLSLTETISVSAERDGKIVGNVLFTPFLFKDHPSKKCYALAPLAVLPEYQGHGHGVGKELVQTGIKKLKSMGADAIFVLGVPTYYPQYGFVPTDKQTPYPDLLTLPKSWMILELKDGATKHLSGETTAVEPFMHPSWWDTSGRG
jgi:putative acetyltransferase